MNRESLICLLVTCVLVSVIGAFHAPAYAAASPSSQMQATPTVPGPATMTLPPSAGTGPGPQAATATAPTTPIAPGSMLTLKQAIHIALEYFPRLRERRSESSAANQAVGVARSFLGPQVYGISQYLRSTENGIGNTSYYDPMGIFPRMTGRNHDLPSNDFSQSWNTSNNYMNGLAVSQFLFDFGRRHGFVAQRQFDARAADKRARLSQLRLIFEVSQRYFALLRAKQLIRVYQKAIEQREFHLREAQVKAKVGLRPELDVYVTTAELERAKLHLIDARNEQDDAKVALDNAMGLSEQSPQYQAANILTYSPFTGNVNDLLRTAFALRPDLQMLEDQARAMGAQIVEYRSDYFPTVNAVGGYAGMGTGLPVANNFNVGILITWPIFNSFETTHQMSEAQFKQRAIQHAIEDLRQQVILQVRTAYLNLDAALQRIYRAEKALAASRAELELSQKRYEAGLASIIELEDAQRHFTYDDANYAEALYTYSVAKASLEEATAQSLKQVM